MRRFIIGIAAAALLLLTLPCGRLKAQPVPSRVKVARTDRPNRLLLDSGELGRFSANFGNRCAFAGMKVVKTELAFYLLASEQGSSRIFAFELVQKGKRLFLRRQLPARYCEEGELSLQAFLQSEGRINGCRKGKGALLDLPPGG